MIVTALLIVNHNLSAQMTVEVPSACEVVVAGTGGTLGFGGTVGSGGIVVMPDPFDESSAAGEFVLTPAGNTITGWTLSGDLSVQTNDAPPVAPTQTVGASVLIVNIQSYNKNLRPSEGTFPSTSTLARSKGRVSIQYESEGCGPNSISFDIYKTYANTSGIGDEYVPPIIGPSCWLPDSSYTYSVDHIASDNVLDAIGVDKYYWYVEDAGEFQVLKDLLYYNSADNSSITLNTPEALNLNTPYTITCCYGRANSWDGDNNPTSPGDHTTCVSLVIGGQPTNPNFVSIVPSCLETGETSFETEIDPEPGYTYTWSASNASWSLSTSGTQGEILEVSSIGDEPGEIKLKIAFGDCTPSEFIYPIWRKFVDPLKIEGESCVQAGSVHKYSLPAGAINNESTWIIPLQPDVPFDWIQTDANGAGSSINLTIPAGTPAGAYTISVASDSCAEGVIYFTVNVQPGKPEITGGDECVIRNNGPTEFYTSSTPSGVTEFIWNLPDGWTCVDDCDTDNPELQPGGSAAGPVYLTVTAIGTNGCNAVSDTFEINYHPAAPINILLNSPCINAGVEDFITFSIEAPQAGTFYGWQVPIGWTITSSNGTDSTQIEVETNGVIDSYTVRAWARSSTCDNSDTIDLPVDIVGLAFNVQTSYFAPLQRVTFYTNPAPVTGAVHYSWFDDGNSPVNDGPTLFFIDLFAPIDNPVCVEVEDTDGCITRKCTSWSSMFRQATAGENKLNIEASIRVYPNPASNQLIVESPNNETSHKIRVVNMEGKEFINTEMRSDSLRLNTSDLAAGTYFVFIASEEGSVVERVQIMK